METPKGAEDKFARGREGDASGSDFPAGVKGRRTYISGRTGRGGGGVEEAGPVQQEGEEGWPGPP